MAFSAALIAGGRSSRMGRDKAFLEIEGVPLWQRQLHVLRELGPSEIFIAGPNHPEWVEHGLEVVADAMADSGPLGGLVAALRRCTNAQLLVLAIDLPNMTSIFLHQLLAVCSEGGGVIPRRHKRFEPLAAVYPKNSLLLAEGCLSCGEYSLQHFARSAVDAGLIVPKEIAAAEGKLFFNLNTAADFAEIEKK